MEVLQGEGVSSSGGKSEQELQEEEDLQLALALSESEAENKEKGKSSSVTSSSLTSPIYSTSAPQNLQYRKMEEFLTNLNTTLESFVNRMESNYSRGLPIANDTYVQSLFTKVTSMHSQMMEYMQELHNQRVHFERLQDTLTQCRDALREVHRERMRREAETETDISEEAERIPQIQMAQKQEYVQHQCQLAMQIMQEQQEHQYLMQGSYPPGSPYIPQAGQMYSLQPQTQGPIMQYQGQQGFPPNYYQPYNMQAMSQALPFGSPSNRFTQGPPVTATAPPSQVMSPHGPPPMSGLPGMQPAMTTPSHMGPLPEAPMPPEQLLIRFD